MTVEKIEEERNQAYAAMQRASRGPTIIKAFHKMFRAPITLEGDISLPTPLPFVVLVKRAIEMMKANQIESASNPETFIFIFIINKWNYSEEIPPP
jgi:hypothetical protein